MKSTESASNETKLVCFKENPRFYALYEYHSNRSGKHKGCESGGGDAQHSSSDPPLSNSPFPEEVSNNNFSLSLIVSSLESENETKLRSFLASRFTRGTVYSGSGNVAALDFSLTNETDCPAICYFCLLRPTDGPSTRNLENVACLQEYAVCYITTATGVLDSYRDELSQYSEDLLPLLSDIETIDLSKIQKYLSEWYDVSVMFTHRCVQKMKDDIASLIYITLQGRKIYIKGDDSKLKADIERFIQSCSIAGLMQNNSSMADASVNESANLKPGSSGETCNASETFETLSIDDGTYILNCKGSNTFCTTWAESLMSLDSAVEIREAIERYKLKLIQSLNLLKRLIRHSQTDHYALYRTYVFLKNSGNADILLHNVKLEDQFQGSADCCQIVALLEEFIQGSGGLS